MERSSETRESGEIKVDNAAADDEDGVLKLGTEVEGHAEGQSLTVKPFKHVSFAESALAAQ